MVLLARVANHEVATLVLIAKDLGNVALIRQIDLGMMRGHVLDWQDARRFLQTGIDHALPILEIGRTRFGADLEHQVRQDLQIGVERLAIERFGDIR